MTDRESTVILRSPDDWEHFQDEFDRQTLNVNLLDYILESKETAKEPRSMDYGLGKGNGTSTAQRVTGCS
jgi:hypothetical protein